MCLQIGRSDNERPPPLRLYGTRRAEIVRQIAFSVLIPLLWDQPFTASPLRDFTAGDLRRMDGWMDGWVNEYIMDERTRKRKGIYIDAAINGNQSFSMTPTLFLEIIDS